MPTPAFPKPTSSPFPRRRPYPASSRKDYLSASPLLEPPPRVLRRRDPAANELPRPLHCCIHIWADPGALRHSRPLLSPTQEPSESWGRPDSCHGILHSSRGVQDRASDTRPRILR